jgi:hypothetical protein
MDGAINALRATKVAKKTAFIKQSKLASVP